MPVHAQNLRWVPAAAVLSLLTACSTFQSFGHFFGIDKPVPAKPKSVLLHSEARERAKAIANVEYALEFAFKEDEAEFSGRETIRFEIKDKRTSSLFLDFDSGKLRALTINGTAVRSTDLGSAYDGARIRLDGGLLKPGANEIAIEYEHAGVNDGNGLHRFVDPIDQRVYWYSNFEPFFANRAFPCFDQPDLKAAYSVRVHAPRSWEVVSNERESEVLAEPEGHLWVFPKTARFSTYLFALHAGPYAVWRSSAGKIPLRLFARQSLAPYVDFSNWFDVTVKGLRYFEKAFDYAYPFKKYDQLIVPDFNAGAMENVGAVTFTERLVYRSKITYEQMRSRANTILHEMAHMWFGNLVTMDWWSGLWLNESFATYLASVASVRALGLSGVWESFHLRSKAGAFQEDSYSTNHPIQAKVEDTDQAFAQFDAITYGKGASVLKQLHYRVGDRGFFGGLKDYFKKFAFKNATIDDFFKSIEKASKQTLAEFKAEWIEKKGFERVRADWSCASGKISAFTLVQSAASQSDVPSRTHHFRIGLFFPDKGAFYKNQSVSVVMKSAAQALPGLVGSPCPLWVHPNLGDYGHFIPVLDAKSFEEVQSQIDRIPEPIDRISVMSSIWDQVRQGDLAPSVYIRNARRVLYREDTLENLGFLTSTLYRPSLRAFTAVKLVKPDQWGKKLAFLEDIYLDLLKYAAPATDEQRFWLQRYAEAAQSPDSMLLLRNLLTGAEQIRGLSLDQDQRWEILQSIARKGGEDVEGLIENERLRDPSDKGRKERLNALASLPDALNKARWWAAFTLPLSKLDPNLRISNVRRAMSGFYPLTQEAFARERMPEFYSQVLPVKESRGDFYAETFAEFLYPAVCDLENVKQTQRLLNRKSEMSEELFRILSRAKEDDELCAAIRAKF